MRRRSGAIHSETQQQFIMLAQKSLNKTGIFYDEKLYKEVQAIQQHSNPSQDRRNKINPFAQFDFDEVKQFQQDQRDLHKRIEQELQVNIKYAIICDDVPAVVDFLANEKKNRNQVREVDLVVRKIVRNDGKCVPLKYWVISSKMIDSPMAKIYLSSAVKIYWISASIPSINNCLELNIANFQQAVAEEQKRYFLS